MGKNRQQLIQEYEDAKLALLLDEYAEVYGKVSVKLFENDVATGKSIPISEEEQQAQLNTILQRVEMEESKKAQVGSRFKGVVRKAATIAASIALFFLLMVSVQAAGIDLFGAVGKWTSELFHFETNASNNESIKEKESTPVAVIKSTLMSYKFPPELAPSWLPEDYSITEIKCSSNDDVKNIAVMLENEANNWIMLRLDWFLSEQGTESLWHQKDIGEVEVLEIDHYIFYLAQNNGVWEAMENSDGYAISIIDTHGKDELLNILQSYGG